jgi:hypothetical protein
MDVAVKGDGRDARIVGVRGRAVDMVNKGRLGPKGDFYHLVMLLDVIHGGRHESVGSPTTTRTD